MNQAENDSGGVAAPRRAPERGRQRVLFAALGFVALAAAITAGIYFSDVIPSFGGKNAAADATTNTPSTALKTVTRRSLSSQTEVNGTLGYADAYEVVNHSQGTVTAVPKVGDIVHQGQSFYSVDGSSVVLLYGGAPAYRSLSPGMNGLDVQNLNRDLVALGYVSSSAIDSNPAYYGAATAQGVAALQRALGADPTGRLDLGQAVFLPSAQRITEVDVTLGAAAPSGLALKTTSTTPQVTVNLDAAQQSEVAVGDQVTVTIGAVGTVNSKSTTGTVSSVGTVAVAGGQGSGPTVPMEITLTDPTALGNVDQAPVSVEITTATVKDALVVPVNALLATLGGGYAVEVVNADGTHHLVAVKLGLFDDSEGLVQVTGSGLAAGQQVVVPSL